MSVTPCVFCSIARERVLATTERTVTIRDAYPVSPGHTLIVPLRHVSSFFDLDEREQSGMLDALRVARAALEEELHPDGFNVGINVGVAAGQTVMHVHMHLIPRFAGDTDDPRGGVRHCIPGKGNYLATPTPKSGPR